MSTPTSAREGRPARRRLLQAAAVLAATLPLAACQEGPLRPVEELGVGSPAVDPDEALLTAAVRAEAQMLALLRPLLTTGPEGVRRTVEVHEAHLALLDRPEEVDGGSGPDRRLRVGGIAAAEERLARRHARAAVRASSGQFARVLAGMAAAAAQQADVWRQGGSAG